MKDIKKICKNCKMYSPNTRYGNYENPDTVDKRYKCLAPTLEAQEYRFDYLKPRSECIHPSYFVKMDIEENEEKYGISPIAYCITLIKWLKQLEEKLKERWN